METLRLRLPAPPHRIDYAQLLNPAQYRAVTTLEGPVLVVAGAGTGKTRTLVFRVARLVESGVDPRSILLLTFTRRAAQEMLGRAARLLDGRCREVAGGTFHSFANSVLQRHGKAVGVEPGFTILDRADAEDLLGLVRARLGLDRRDRRFPHKRTLGAIRSALANRPVALAELLAAEYSHLAEHAAEIEAVLQAYAEHKQQQHLVDYDDLLLLLRDLLAAHPQVREALTARYRYVMVDEYQDTNRVQAEIVRLLAGPEENVLVVGDEAQSIYGFRGADFRNIMDFPKLFPRARIIPLEHNYRSTQPILDVANALLKGAAEKYEKHLRSDLAGGPPPWLAVADGENEQSRFVCQRVLELREEGVPLSEIAVLFRAGFHSFDLELELARHGIPFVKRGGFRFVESAHVKDVLAHLRVLANPLDSVSWLRVLLLIEGVGPRTAQRIAEAVAAGGNAVAVLESARVSTRGGPVDLRHLGGLLRRMDPLRSDPAALVTEVLGYYEPILRIRYPDDYPRRKRDLEHFVGIASRHASLEDLLARVALEPPADALGNVLAPEDPEQEGLLTLSTVHSAKGLEWHAVFVLWAVEGRFPPLQSQGSAEELEEERRLFYVAVTRAKRELYLLCPAVVYERGVGYVSAEPSRFARELSGDVLRRAQIREEAPGGER